MTEPAVLDAPPLAAAGPLADLILRRLLPAKRSVRTKVMRADLAPLFRRPPSEETFDVALNQLKAAGLVTAKGQQLTAAGRSRALGYAGATELPPRATWETVKAKFLVPKVLGLSADAEEFDTADKLAAVLMKRKFGLPPGTGTTLTAVFEAIVCRELGYHTTTTLQALRAAVLSKAAGLDTPLGKKDAGKVVPRLLLGTNRSGARPYRAAALAGFADAAAAPETADEPFDLEAFAATVRSVARRCPTGRFGDNKVFISHVWAQLRDEPRFAALGLAGFKDKLVEANRAGLLTLSRADMVEELDAADLDPSATAFLNAVYHFILIEKE